MEEELTAERQRWITALKPGDMVCDCKRRHRRIVKIDDEYSLSGWSLFVSTCLWVVNQGAAEGYAQEALQTGKGCVIDRRVTFADGSQCSAKSCLDPIGPGCKLHEGCHDDKRGVGGAAGDAGDGGSTHVQF